MSPEGERPTKRRRGLAAAVGAAPTRPGRNADTPAITADTDHPAAERGADPESPRLAAQSAGGWLRQRSQDDRSAGRTLTMVELSERLQAAVGHTLRVAPSAVRHLGAGDGLWLDGAAQAGAVVALYPGVVYTALHHRRDRSAATRHTLSVATAAPTTARWLATKKKRSTRRRAFPPKQCHSAWACQRNDVVAVQVCGRTEHMNTTDVEILHLTLRKCSGRYRAIRRSTAITTTSSRASMAPSWMPNPGTAARRTLTNARPATRSVPRSAPCVGSRCAAPEHVRAPPPLDIAAIGRPRQ